MSRERRLSPPDDDPAASSRELELAIARLLNLGAVASVLLLAVGVVALAASGRSPLDADWATLDPGRIPADIAALRPEGFLWLGLIFVLLTPTSRVLASLVGFATSRERAMALISVGVLIIIAAGIVLSLQAA